MNQIAFINGVKVAVADSSMEALKSTLTTPAGQNPAEYLMLLSSWYNSLTVNDREIVIKIVKEAIDTTVFSFLCVLDGVRAVENSRNKGIFKLYYQKGDNIILLNDPDEDYLHDIW